MKRYKAYAEEDLNGGTARMHAFLDELERLTGSDLGMTMVKSSDWPDRSYVLVECDASIETVRKAANAIGGKIASTVREVERPS